MSRLFCHTGLLSAVLLACLLVPPEARASALTDCYLEAIEQASPETTVSELREACAGEAPASSEDPANPPKETSKKPDDEYADLKGASFTRQIAAERQSLDRSYSLTPHQPNYLLAYSLRNDPSNASLPTTEGDLDKQEAVLQISVKFPLWRKILGTNNDVLFSYTSKSWFQAYNSALSKPFRETNYEPEIFFRHYGGPRLPLGVKIAGWDLGYNHQSNGRSEPQSRSWDRIMGRLGLDVTESVSVALRAWYRIPESSDEDDNPDIHQYLGYGDIRAIWTPNRNTFTAMYRPGTQEHGFELTWSYPLTKHFRLFTQYYNGYGESLIDYDQKVERIGIGFTINDFLQVQ